MARFKSKYAPFATVDFDSDLDIRSMQLHPDYIQIDEKGDVVDNSLVVELSTKVSREPAPTPPKAPKSKKKG